MSEGLLEIENVGRRFGGVIALEDVSFELRAGSVLGVIGPNGAGKSTLVGALVGDPIPTAGRIVFEGKDVSSMTTYRRSRLGMVRTHQIPRPLASMSVRRNIQVAGQAGHDHSVERAEEIADHLGLRRFLDTVSGELNHANLRRLEVARALAVKPRLLLLDEMGAGLSKTELEEFILVIRGLADSGIMIIVVEHIMELVMTVSDRILVLDNGRVVTLGTPDDVRKDQTVLERYLGIS